MKIYLYDHLQDYAKLNTYPFHMPGHKRRADFFPTNFLALDVTEFGKFDNLHEPSDTIALSLERAADLFGARRSFFLVNGSTAGLMAAIVASVSENEEIIVSRSCHKSIYNGLIISGAKPVYIYPKITPLLTYGGIEPNQLSPILLAYPKAKAVVVTSPTYEGFVLPIKEIAEVIHRHGKILIVDEAHGAHFKFHPDFPQPALESGADIVVHSLHKTLPALGQTGLLHINGMRVDSEKISRALNILQTTSPSYIFMGLMDYLMAQLEENKLPFNRYIKLLTEFRDSFSGNDKVHLFQISNKYGIKNFDPSRLVFDLRQTKLNGSQAEEILAKDYGVQMELSGICHIVGISTVADTADGFSRLRSAIKALGETSSQACTEIPEIIPPPPKAVYIPRDASFMESENQLLANCIGRIAAGFLTVYPPGVPLLVPGETVTNEILEYIRLIQDMHIPITGILNGCIPVLKN